MNIFSNHHWRFIDQTTIGLTMNPIYSFAIDDTLCLSVTNSEAAAIIRTWVHPNTIVLGIQDSRLPFIKEGITYLATQGYNVIVRNSGGLAVVLDEGILNISLIFKEDRQISINSGYEAMYELVQKMFQEETSNIEAREIEGSYCPGSFDLSINNKKFAGISQRRVRGGVAVQIYLCINGSGSDRAAIIQQFYERAVQNGETKYTYPTIHPETMASLSELLGKDITIQDVMVRLLKTLKWSEAVVIEATQLYDYELELYEANVLRMQKRNEEINKKD